MRTSGGSCTTRALEGSTITTPPARRLCGISPLTVTLYLWQSYR